MKKINLIVILILFMAMCSQVKADFMAMGVNPASDSVITVAASDTPEALRRHADYKCDGTADEVEIHAARDALPNVGGKIQLLDGTYYIATPIILYRDIGGWSVMLAGTGIGNTLITQPNNNNAEAIIKVYPVGLANTVFTCIRDLTVDGNGHHNTDTKGIMRTNIGGGGTIFDFRVENVMVIRCPTYGISLVNPWGDQLVNCITEFNGTRGLFISGGGQVYVNNLFAAYNGWASASSDGGAGIYMTCQKSVFSNMVIYNNAGDGIYISHASGAEIGEHNNLSNVVIHRWGDDGNGKTNTGSSALYVNTTATKCNFSTFTIRQSEAIGSTYRGITCLGSDHNFTGINITRWGTRSAAGGAIVIGTAAADNQWSNIKFDGQDETNAKIGISCAGDRNIFSNINGKNQSMNPVVFTADANDCLLNMAILEKGSNASEEISNSSADCVVGSELIYK